MENSTKSALYKLMSYLLTYPGEPKFCAGLPDALEWAHQLEPVEEVKKLVIAIEKLSAYTKDDLDMEYVNTFDFSERCALYLTAHELGDSRNRGPALLQLRQYFIDLGIVEEAYELPDYLPALFELLAIMPEEIDPTPLLERLSVVCQHILEALPETSPYRFVFEVSLGVFGTVVPETENPFPLREGTDLDQLPFPVFYD